MTLCDDTVSQQLRDKILDAIAGLGLTNPEDPELMTQIGATDSSEEGVWTWAGDAASLDGPVFWQGNSADDDGAAVGGAYQDWALGEPNDDRSGEDCAALSVFGGDEREPGQWDDRDCDVELPFVCEVP
jgi:hypothetical protein